ncbi:hypothetical protein H6G72_14510 [Planktothricoides sp. FACHB-1370]|uniref:Uncharacterized protein n=2 Tax=Planktothricoides raciborskii TaxID=132608 RepID=A0AAU8J6R3_9CYAN|nr:hypothetical protein [Planktothricoides raciborskii]MBD2545024.1 hypothetical protein [Planktothricoides raciborskii FACHB-1370]MBD2584838.1 hypothetical protein [Planktothricoides raciborskii FACHB-1261]
MAFISLSLPILFNWLLVIGYLFIVVGAKHSFRNIVILAIRYLRECFAHALTVTSLSHPINNQQPTINHQQPTTNNQQPTTNHQQPTTNN